MTINIKTESCYPNVDVIASEKKVIISSSNYPVYSTFSISHEEAAELAQKLMDAVSEHINRVSAEC